MVPLQEVILKRGAEMYFRVLPHSPLLAGLMLTSAERLNGTGKLVKVIKSAQIEDRTMFKVIERLSTEINPRCREIFMNHHIPMLFKSDNGKEGFFPKVLIISVTARCNFTCPDCFNNTFKGKGDLSTDVLDKILWEAEAKGTKIVALSGGEPIVRSDLLDIIRRHPGLYFQIYTNGSLISSVFARTAAELGNVMPFISLEGSEKLTDKRRGPGCWKGALDAMKRLSKHGVIFGSNVMVTPENFESATSDEFISELVRAGTMAIWYITYRPIGENPDPEMVLPRGRHLELYRRIQVIRNTYPIVALENLHDVSYFGGCPARLGVLVHIDHLGNVTPCPPLHFSNQNIMDQSLEDALNRSPLIRSIMENESPGCIILDEPSKLEEIVLDSQAKETSQSDELKTIRSFMTTDIREKEEPLQKDPVSDFYQELMEALRRG
jgi:MoaA/NifB/PqqE/SkfB family radical SAM enzyme